MIWYLKKMFNCFSRVAINLWLKKDSSSFNMTSAIFRKYVYMSSLDFFQCFDKHLRPHWRHCLDDIYFQIPQCLLFQSWKCLSKYRKKEIQGVMSGPSRASGRHAESNGFEIHHPKPPLSVNLSVEGFRQVETIL